MNVAVLQHIQHTSAVIIKKDTDLLAAMDAVIDNVRCRTSRHPDAGKRVVVDLVVLNETLCVVVDVDAPV